MDDWLPRIDWAISHILWLETETKFSTWHGGQRLPDGSIQMPYSELTKKAQAFVSGCYSHGLLLNFSWMDWQDGAAMLREGRLHEAGMQECLMLLTAILRTDRFVEGHLGESLKNGQTLSVLRRMRELRQAGEPFEIALDPFS